jgi:hypothetical protein
MDLFGGGGPDKYTTKLDINTLTKDVVVNPSELPVKIKMVHTKSGLIDKPLISATILTKDVVVSPPPLRLTIKSVVWKGGPDAEKKDCEYHFYGCEYDGTRAEVEAHEEICDKKPRVIDDSWGEDWQQNCQILIDRLFLDADYQELADPFYSPVDSTGLPNYGITIKTRMDLGTARRKLEDEKYSNPDEFLADVRLAFENCFYYWNPYVDSPDRKPLLEKARTLSDMFECDVAKIVDGNSLGSDEDESFNPYAITEIETVHDRQTRSPTKRKHCDRPHVRKTPPSFKGGGGKKPKGPPSDCSSSASDDDNDSDLADSDIEDDGLAAGEASAQMKWGSIDAEISQLTRPDPGVQVPGLGFNPTESVPDIVPKSNYATHEEFAEKLFAKMKAALMRMNQENVFTNFAFHIQVPEMINLRDQTIKRLAEFISEKNTNLAASFFPGADPSQFVCMNQKTPTAEKQFSKLVERVNNEPNTLFLLVHDEAHWQATCDGAADTHMNQDALRLAPNVLHLSVTATPYNLLTKQSQIPDEHVVLWDPAPDTYYGQEKFTAKLDSFEAGSMNGTFTDSARNADGAAIKYDDRLKQLSKNYTGKGINKNGTLHTLAESYIQALRKAKDDPTRRFQSPSDKMLSNTDKMIQDLINSPLDNNGDGIMILLRTTHKEPGLAIAKRLREVRKKLGLQRRFAVIADMDEKGKSSVMDEMKTHNKDLLKELTAKNGGTMPRLFDTYESLENVPCILILCEKGKMGDSFPQSLKYYDLRLRYATIPTSRAAVIQDLGRGFGYRSGEQVPIILIGSGCMQQLKQPRGTRPAGLISIDPDKDKMESIDSKVKVFPGNEFETAVYREHWQAKDTHFDWHGHTVNPNPREDWCSNPRRFLLFGRPQIGKTAAYQHLIYLLWKEFFDEKDAPKGTIEPVEDEDSDDGDGADEDNDNMGLYPKYNVMEKQPFDDRITCVCGKPPGCKMHSPGRGKYGDPKVPELWKWYVEEHKRELHPDASKYSTATTRKGAAAVTASTEEPHKTGPAPSTTPTNSTSTGGGAAAPKSGTEKAVGEPKVGVTFYTEPWSADQVSLTHETEKISVAIEDESAGMLHIPTFVAAEWLEQDDAGAYQLKMKPHSDEDSAIRFPIFMPTYNRSGGPAAEAAATAAGTDPSKIGKGLLSLDRAMWNPHTNSRLAYFQILVVKPGAEYKTYRKDWPNATIFELPVESEEFGIGFSRHCIQKLAAQLCPVDFRFCFVMDDSTHYFKGLTLPGDPLQPPPFGAMATQKNQWCPQTSMGQVMLYLQDDAFEDRAKFAGVGFHRKRPGLIKRAFKRAHIYSAMFLNVGLLNEKRINYDKQISIWEDIEFNRFASSKHLVFCKSYRFQQVKFQIRNGGCADVVARSGNDDGDDDDVDTDEDEGAGVTVTVSPNLASMSAFLLKIGCNERLGFIEDAVKKLNAEGFETEEDLQEMFNLHHGGASFGIRLVETWGVREQVASKLGTYFTQKA